MKITWAWLIGMGLMAVVIAILSWLVICGVLALAGGVSYG